MITTIVGLYGDGKTSLMYHLAGEAAFNNERNAAMQAKVLQLNKTYGLDIPVLEHAVYTVDSVVFRKFGYTPRRSLKLDMENFGVQKYAPANMKCQFLLPWSTLAADEGHMHFSSDEVLPPHKKNAIDVLRHWNIDLFLTTPRAMAINVHVRNATQGLFIKDRKVIYTKEGFISGVKWTVDFVPSGYFDAYIKSDEKDQKRYAEEKVIFRPRNIYDCYSSTSREELFYEGYTPEQIKGSFIYEY